MTTSNGTVLEPAASDGDSTLASETARPGSAEPTTPDSEHGEVANGQSGNRQASKLPVTVTPPQQRSLFRRFAEWGEARIARLSVKNNFWHRLCSRVFLPLAYRSGIKFSRGDESTFSAILPFRKFNKNWYNAMAGGALLGNAEVAGGMYVFKQCGANYTIVCKHLEYQFRRPCHGPAVYRVEPRQDIQQLVAEQGEFNITLDMQIVQMVHKPGQKERRCGSCTATYHVTPKDQARERATRRKRKNA